MAAGDGLISMTPTSIAHAGTSATINADGGVDFSAVTSLSLNGVFTGDYDNYLIVYRGPDNGAVDSVVWQLRASGSDASGSNYVEQRLRADDTTISGARSTQTFFRVGRLAEPAGFFIHVYGPALAQPTAARTVTTEGVSNARINDFASTHSLSTSYDGATFVCLAPTALSGNVHVFGYEE